MNCSASPDWQHKGSDMEQRSENSLAVSVERAVREYLDTMDDQQVTDLYQLVLSEIEGPLIECVLQFADNNQSRTAEILGLSRGTLRKKLGKYRLL